MGNVPRPTEARSICKYLAARYFPNTVGSLIAGNSPVQARDTTIRVRSRYRRALSVRKTPSSALATLESGQSGILESRSLVP
jgi:hypothetical protein